MLSTWLFFNCSAEKAEIAIGTSCRFSSRLRAVTTISSMACCASATSAASKDAAIATAVRSA